MQYHNKNLTEASHIAEELMGVDAFTRKCNMIKRTVAEDDFTLTEALDAYSVSKEDYLKFLVKQALLDVIPPANSPKTKALLTVSLFKQVYLNIIGDLDKDASKLTEHLDDLSHSIEDDKVSTDHFLESY